MTASMRTGIRGQGEVSVAPLREAFLRMEPGLRKRSNGPGPWDAGTLVAERLGWYDQCRRLDSARVRRVLGLRPYPMGHGRGSRIRQEVTYDMAVRLCEAMDLDPVDFDL